MPAEGDAPDIGTTNQGLSRLVLFFGTQAAFVNDSDSCYSTIESSKVPALLDSGASFTNTAANQPLTNAQLGSERQLVFKRRLHKEESWR